MTISSKSAERISLLYGVAKGQGSLVSVRELLPLLPEETSETDLQEAFRSNQLLSSRFELKAGFVTERFDESVADDPVPLEMEYRAKAESNLRFAAHFVALIRDTGFTMMAVSGSTSYGSAAKSKDLDLFCVAPVGRMWLSLGKGLLFARVYRLLRRSSPQVCFSIIMDRGYAEYLFAENQGPLFARDALECIVMHGEGTYQTLLQRARWISESYPKAYLAKEKHQRDQFPDSSGPSAFETVADKFLFLLLGRYVRMKSWLLNRRLSQGHRQGDVFDIRTTEDHLIYESRRYSDLRLNYSVALETGPFLRATQEAGEGR